MYMLAELWYMGATCRSLRAWESARTQIASAHVVLLPLIVTTRSAEMESCAHRLKQNMRDQFRIQLMALPTHIRKMSVNDFCNKYHCDVNQVVSAEIVRTKNAAATVGATPVAASSPRKVPRTSARDAVKPVKSAQQRGGVNNRHQHVSGDDAAVAAPGPALDLAMLQGKDASEQMRLLNEFRAQIAALQSQLQVSRVGAGVGGGGIDDACAQPPPHRSRALNEGLFPNA